MGYDGFISYSHDDADTASRLQSGLQQFAKPWWRRRALHVFRDDANLGANPALWESIASALDDSEWLVVLLSPDAAQSEWVDREVAHWVASDDCSRVLLVLLEGEFGWRDGDVHGDIPPSLEGAFSEEPRWVDLRFARDPGRLSLADPRFADAVADLASTMRRVPKDELAGEEVRQHRRTVVTAWAAVVALLALAIAAVGFGISSARSADEAREQAARADANAERADAVAAEALAEAERADQAARQLIEFALNAEEAGIGRPGTDFLPVFVSSEFVELEAPPENPRLDFLQEHCPNDVCRRAGSFLDVDRGLRTPFRQTFAVSGGSWLADDPFHIRHGFPNPEGESFAERRARGWIVNVYVTRADGPPTPDFRVGETQLLGAGQGLTEHDEACGPSDGVDAVECDRWVFDFPDGMPEGRYDFFVEWVAPCETWFQSDVCPSPNRPVSFLAVATSLSFVSEDFPFPTAEPVGVWPWDPWADAEPIPAG